MNINSHHPLRIFTWHVHGSYLFYLSQLPHELYVPVDAGQSPGYAGRTPSYPWPQNVIEVPKDKVREMAFDCILFQSQQNYLTDQYEVLSAGQRRLPAVYLEHDPPREHPTDTRHPVQSRDILLVHVTPFNQLMWDAGPTPTGVVEHGVHVPDAACFTGELEKGIVVVNHLRRRGRRLGYDLWQQARAEVPLDLVGMGWQEAGGLTEISHHDLPFFMARYRFFFNPIRYTSLGLAVCEAMAVGLPIVGLATTEMVSVVPDGVAGYLDTRPERLIPKMQELLQDRQLAIKLGEGARSIARERFSIGRFVKDWDAVLKEVTGVSRSRSRQSSSIRCKAA